MLTTIAISKELRDKLKEFGNKGDTYEDILTRLYESANRRLLQDVLMDTKNAIPIEDAIVRARKRWRVS